MIWFFLGMGLGALATLGDVHLLGRRLDLQPVMDHARQGKWIGVFLIAVSGVIFLIQGLR